MLLIIFLGTVKLHSLSIAVANKLPTYNKKLTLLGR